MNTIQGATVLITGAGRGIGKAYAQVFLQAGAKKIYLGVRHVKQVTEFVACAPEQLIPLKLDVTNEMHRQQTAEIASDVDVLVNNAGILYPDSFASSCLVDNARRTMEVNYIAPLALNQIFSPILQKNGGGLIIIVASIVSYFVFPKLQSYAASKFAVHSLILSSRLELAAQGTKVIGVYPGPIATDMARSAGFEGGESSDIVPLKTLEAIKQGKTDVFPDAMAQAYYTMYTDDPKALENKIIQSLSTVSIDD